MKYRGPETEVEEKTRTRTKIRASEQEPPEEEPDIEHEEIQINVRAMFELHRDIDPVIIDCMNSLAEILARGNEANLNDNARGRRHEVRLSDEEENIMTGDLERILETFEQDEISQEKPTEATCDNPI
jgi:hypothetical protein